MEIHWILIRRQHYIAGATQEFFKFEASSVAVDWTQLDLFHFGVEKAYDCGDGAARLQNIM